jgi:hypothetical protein
MTNRAIGLLVFVYLAAFVFAPMLVGVYILWGAPIALLAFAGLSLSLFLAAIGFGAAVKSGKGRGADGTS